LRADVSSLKVDAIVAAKDSSTTHNGEPVATVTPGGNLLARFVIHVAQPDEGNEEQLREVTAAAIERGEELAISSVGIPALARGFSIEQCARVMLRAAMDHEDHARSVQRVVFCLFGRQQY